TLECMGSVNLKSKHSVTDMTFLSPRANAVVASLASTISILDISTNKLLNLLVGHRLGVTCIKYSVAYRYIISAGLDHDLRVRSHRHQVVGLTWVDDSPEVHSVDEAGFLKIWDLRTYRCIQTLCTLTATSATRSADAALKPTRDVKLSCSHVRVWNAQTGQLTYNLRALVPTTISAGCYGSGPVAFLGTQAGMLYVSAVELIESRDRTLARRVVSTSLDGTCVVSDSETLALVHSMNHWHGINGHPLTRVAPTVGVAGVPHDYFVPQPTKAAYSDYAIDCLKRIFAPFDPHKTGEIAASHLTALFDAVVSLNRRSGQRNPASCTTHGTGRRPDLGATITSYGRTGYVTSDVGCVAVSHQYNVIVTASIDGHFCVWHGSKCQPLASSPDGASAGITAVVFLEPHPIFAVTDDQGGLGLFAIPPHPLRFERLVHTTCAATVHSLAWCLPRTLVTGDDEGKFHQNINPCSVVGYGVTADPSVGYVTSWRIDGLFAPTTEDAEPAHISDSRRTAHELMQTKVSRRRGRRRCTHQFDYMLEGQ
ncbi:hypothetical protein DYB38_013182, partial [Aphanomyces astaci]